MSVKNARKIGFLAALAILVGSVIGVGIFFKNNSVARATDHQGIVWIIAWVSGGILSLAAAVSFSKIGTYEHPKLAGLSAWAYRAGGKKFGYLSRFNFGFFYYGIFIAVFGTFGSETLFSFFSTTGVINYAADFPFWGHMLIGFGITAFFIVLNIISLKASGMFQIVSTVLKFIPLLIAIIVGIVFATTYNLPREDGSTAAVAAKSAFENTDFKIAGIFAALPAVLFAYDAFLGVGALTHKTKGGERTVSKVVIFGMLGIVILYTLIALSSALHNQGTIVGLIQDSLPTTWANGVNVFVTLFLFISTIGVANGLTAAFVNEVENNVNVGTYFKSIKLREKLGITKATIVYVSIFTSFWALIIFIPSLIVNGSKGTDVLVDGFSNFPTFFFYVMYAITILLHYFQIYKKEKEEKNWLFEISAWVAIVGILMAVIAFFIYLGIDVSINPDKKVSWGIFVDNEFKMARWVELVLFALAGIAFVSIPLINKLVVQKFENRDVFELN